MASRAPLAACRTRWLSGSTLTQWCSATWQGSFVASNDRSLSTSSSAASSAPSSSTSTSTDDDSRPKLAVGHKGRFYRTVVVKEVPEGFQVLLDKYPIKTPAKHLLVLPTKALALAIAAEWEWQEKGKPQLHSMPLMSVAATALDQPKPREKVEENMMKYLHTDSACCRYEGGALARRQAEVFNPLLAWARETLGWKLLVSDSIFGPTQPDDTVAKAKEFISGLDKWQLAAAEQITSSSKSLLLAAALVKGHLRPRDAISAAQLEEDHQMAEWGMVEAGHDLDIADMNSRIGAPAVFLRLLELRG